MGRGNTFSFQVMEGRGQEERLGEDLSDFWDGHSGADIKNIAIPSKNEAGAVMDTQWEKKKAVHK